MSRSYYKDIGLQVCKSNYQSDYLIRAYELVKLYLSDGPFTEKLQIGFKNSQIFYVVL